MGLYLVGNALGAWGTVWAILLALMGNAMATMTIFVCLNAKVLDHVARVNLGRSRPVQMVHAAAARTLGPLTGVWLCPPWAAAPFPVAGAFSQVLLGSVWVLRLGNGKQIARACRPAVHPLGDLGRCFGPPRLIAGWMFAVLRSCGWRVYVVCLPIFCIEAGLGDKVGGIALSVRRSVRLAFGVCGALFSGAGLLAVRAVAGAPAPAVGPGAPVARLPP